jgi:hypothetical protein
MHFRTEIKVKPSYWAINYQTPTLLLGSCFAVNIGAKLQAAKLPVAINPFGVLYNPASIGNNVARLLSQQAFSPNELYQYRDLWLSFDHHSTFSSTDPAICQANINDNFAQTCHFLAKTRFLVITFGTAFIYKRQDTNQVVANCHQLPAAFFRRELLSVEQITAIWTPLIRQLLAQNPDLKLLFTLSPIRHWKDGAADNQLSKALLTVAIHQLIAQFSQQTTYFPAYELLMDDLRDYRFYESDMLHPNNMAIDYIWQKFREQYIYEASSQQLMRQISTIVQAAQHRPRQPNTESHRQFAQKMLHEIVLLEQQYPDINWEIEKRVFKI